MRVNSINEIKQKIIGVSTQYINLKDIHNTQCLKFWQLKVLSLV